MRARLSWRLGAWAIAVAALLAAFGCSSTAKVGNKALLNIQEKTGGGFESTTTSTLPATLPPAVGTATTRPPVTAPKHQAPTTLSPAQQRAITVVIGIEPDTSLSQFNPSSQSAYDGTPVKWVNQDSKPRSVVADDGVTFASPLIPPGGSQTWVASGPPRRINYHDGTRPYAVADIVLVAHP